MTKNIIGGTIATVLGGILLYFLLDRLIKPAVEPSGHAVVKTDTTTQSPASKEGKETQPTKSGFEAQPKGNEAGNKPPAETHQPVQVLLIVDAVYSNALIYADGVQVSPINNTPTVKELEIPFTKNTITLEVKAGNKSCEKLITVPRNYFDKPYKLEVICSE